MASTVAEDGGTRVVVRAVPSGRVVASVARPEAVLSGAFAGDHLVIGGHLPGSAGRDPGLVAILLRDGTVSVVIPPRDLPGWSGDVARTVAASPSGRTIVSGVCGLGRCSLDVASTGSWVVRRIAVDLAAYPGATTDEVVLVGDGASGWIAGLDLATGERRWAREDGEFQHAYALADGRFVQAVASVARGTFTLELLDPATGLGRPVLTGELLESLTLWPELSDDLVAVVGRGERFADAALAGPRVVAGTVELDTGRYLPAGLAIDLGP